MNKSSNLVTKTIPLPDGFEPFPESAITGTYVDRFESIVARFPKNIAVIDHDHRFTYSELNQKANQVSWMILDKFGSKPERVGFLAKQDIFSVINIWGILKSGKTYVALDPALPIKQLIELISDIGISSIISPNTSREMDKELHSSLPHLEILDTSEAMNKRTDNPNIIVSVDVPPYIIYTSGTTGKPKIIPRHTRGMLNMERVKTNSLGFLSKDCWSITNPLCYGASNFGLFGALLNGGTACIYDLPLYGLQDFDKWIKSENITVLLSTPPVFRSIFGSFPLSTQFPSVRLIILTGDTMIYRDMDVCNEHFADSCILANVLALTEVGIITLGFINRSIKTTGLIPVGFPLDGIDIRFIGENGQDVNKDEIGEIFVQNHYLSQYPLQYLDKKTGLVNLDAVKVLQSQKTGDMGRFLEDGSIEFLGRKDSVVKIHGLRIDTSEIEAILLKHPCVKQASVVGLKSQSSGELVIVAYIVRQSEISIKKEELRDYLISDLPQYKIPSRFIFIDEIPLNTNGKVDRAQLPEPDWFNAESETPHAVPQNQVELRLLQIWQSVLNIKGIGIHHDFLSLGGESLQALQIIDQINSEWSLNLNSQVLVNHPTISQLALAIGEAKGNYFRSSIIPLRSSGSFPALFMVPAAARTTISLSRLASHLDYRYKIYTLEYPGMEGYQNPLDTVESLASYFIDQIKTIQPAGPYHLIGPCLAGTIIFEMAQQLSKADQEVGLIGAIDTTLPNLYIREQSTLCCSQFWAIKKIRILTQNLEILVLRIISWLRRSNIINKQNPLWLKGKFRLSPYYPQGRPKNALDPHSWEVFANLKIAKAKYAPKPYSGRVLVILSNTALNTSQEKIWQELVNKIECHYILGSNHRDLFVNEANLIQIAQIINKYLQQNNY